MIRPPEDSSLAHMNSTVALLVVVPLLLIMLALGRPAPELPPAPPKPLPEGETLDQPPVITISEAEVYSFPSGRADISAEFRSILSGTITTRLSELSGRYRCDVIEVVGHTDEQGMHTRSNLDEKLLASLSGDGVELTAGSDVDLGLLRAIAVIGVLRETKPGMTYYAYSAGQAILPGGGRAPPHREPDDDPARRRIEIRLRRSALVSPSLRNLFGLPKKQSSRARTPFR